MKRTHVLANAAVASLVLLLVQCSSDSESDDDSAEGGSAGSAASAGKGGNAGSSSGSAGKGGTGSAGKGGSAGSGGTSAGTSGTGAAGAATGGAGEAGAAGANTGAAGESGSGGSDAGGAAGDDGNAGAAGSGSGGAPGGGNGGESGDDAGGSSNHVGGAGGDNGGAGSGGEGPVAVIGDECAHPLPLGEGSEIAGSLASDGIDHDYDIDPCLEGTHLSGGPDVVYRLDLPTATTLTVTIHPSDALDAMLFLQIAQGPTCNLESCLGAAENGGPGEDETVAYTNLSGFTQTVYVIVDSFAGDLSTPGPFHLDVNLTP